MKLKEIQELIDKSISIHNELLEQVKVANECIEQYQSEFLSILQNQNKCLFLKRYVTNQLDKNQLSDLIHLFEFKYLKLQGLNTKIANLLQKRRRCKLLITYVHSIQTKNGFSNSVYWYNIHNKHIQYTLRTDLLGYKKGEILIKKS